MEASARKVWSWPHRQAKVYQFFYTADYVDHHNHEWDVRRAKMENQMLWPFFDIAVDIALELEK